LGKSGGTWALDPAKVFSGGGKLDLDCAECGTQLRNFLGKNQEIADKAVGSVATEARVLIKSHLLYQNPS
jgi:hypothetical protein